MTAAIAITGLSLFRLGLLTSVDSEGRREFVSTTLAGCGMAAFLGAATAIAFTPFP